MRPLVRESSFTKSVRQLLSFFTMKYYLLLAMVLCVLPLGTVVFAQSKAPTKSQIVANVDLTDVSAINTEGTLTGNFSLTARGGPQPDVVYGLVTRVDGVIRDITSLGEVNVLPTEQTKTFSFEYELPKAVSGELAVQVVAYTEDGLPLGARTAYKSTVSGGTVPKLTCVLDPKSIGALVCDSDTTFLATASYYQGSELMEPVLSEEVQFTKGEATSLSPQLPSGKYTAVIRGNSGTIVSMSTLFRPGIYGKILNVVTDVSTEGILAGTVAIEGAIAEGAKVVLRATEGNGSVCGEGDVELKETVATFSFPVSCAAGTVVASLVLADGSVLDIMKNNYSSGPASQTVDGQVPVDVSTQQAGSSLPLYALLGGVVIVLLAAALYLYTKGRGPRITADDATAPLLILIALIGISLVSPTQVNALTLMTGTAGYPVSCGEGTCNGSAYEAVAVITPNKSNYVPGETAIVEVTLDVTPGSGVMSSGGEMSTVQEARVFYNTVGGAPGWNIGWSGTDQTVLSSPSPNAFSGMTTYTVTLPADASFGLSTIEHGIYLQTESGVLGPYNSSDGAPLGFGVWPAAPAGSCLGNFVGNTREFEIANCDGDTLYSKSPWLWVDQYEVTLPGGVTVLAHNSNEDYNHVKTIFMADVFGDGSYGRCVGTNLHADKVSYYENLTSLPSCTPTPVPQYCQGSEYGDALADYCPGVPGMAIPGTRYSDGAPVVFTTSGQWCPITAFGNPYDTTDPTFAEYLHIDESSGLCPVPPATEDYTTTVVGDAAVVGSSYPPGTTYCIGALIDAGNCPMGGTLFEPEDWVPTSLYQGKRVSDNTDIYLRQGPICSTVTSSGPFATAWNSSRVYDPDTMPACVPPPVGPITYQIGDTISLSATIRNIGAYPAPSAVGPFSTTFNSTFTIQWGGTTGAWSSISGGTNNTNTFWSGSSEIFTATFVPSRSGTLYVRHCADSGNVIDESGSEGNNCLVSAPIIVGAASPTIELNFE